MMGTPLESFEKERKTPAQPVRRQAGQVIRNPHGAAGILIIKIMAERMAWSLAVCPDMMSCA
ncbi:MAG: hypothetical protein HRU31_05690 [Rhodobacteraceae bacterium]|nr:hypothetical protein [Paracoccaceae bacterium]